MIGRILRADWLKMKRTWIVILVVLGPLGVVGLQAVNYAIRYDYLVKPGTDPWPGLIGNVHMLLVPALLLGITLLCSIMAGLEHDSSAWKQILALPVSRVGVYVAKFVSLAGLLFLSALLTSVGIALLGMSLQFTGPVPWKAIMAEGLFPFFASFAVMALQMWLSVTYQNQAFPIMMGVAGVVSSMYFSMGSLTNWLPWAYPNLSFPLPVDDERIANDPGFWVPVGLVVGFMLLALGSGHFSKRDIQ